MGSRDPARSVVIVDDDEGVAATLERVLTRDGYDVRTFQSSRAALDHLTESTCDVVLSDVAMPGMSGLELLSRLRRVAPDVPVVFMTGVPRIEDTVRAIELGAFRYLTKPVDAATTREVVHAAVAWGQLARASGSALRIADRAALEERFSRALEGLTMAYQPIVSSDDKTIFGYEALMRSSEPTLPSPPAVLDAAEKLGRLHELGRHIRALVAAQASARPYDHALFINLHAGDLADPQLFEASAPLSAHACAVVLEVTERASLELVGDVESRLRRLREMGYRVAVDDLGAGYAGLSYFAQLAPEVVKLDMSLTRGIDRDPVRQRVVASIAALAHELDMVVVAEGVETSAEFGSVSLAGADLVQGYFIAKPGPYPSAPGGEP